MDGPILDEETGQILGDADDQDESNYRIEVSYYKGKNGKTYGPYKTKVRRQTVRQWYIFENYCQTVTLLIRPILNFGYESLGQIPYFHHFVWARQPADADCEISNKYYSELLTHVSKNGKSWYSKNIPIIIRKSQVIGIFSSCKNFSIF